MVLDLVCLLKMCLNNHLKCSESSSESRMLRSQAKCCNTLLRVASEYHNKTPQLTTKKLRKYQSASHGWFSRASLDLSP